MNNTNIKNVIALLTGAVVLLIIGFCFQNNQKSTEVIFSSEMLFTSMSALMFVTVLILFLFSIKLFTMIRQEKTIEFQKFYIGHLYEMIGVVKSQRHDFINHMQIVYTLLQLGEQGRAYEYVAELCREVQITGEMLKIRIPELTAILLAKKNLADALGIKLNIEAESDLAKIQIKPIELSSIISNLVDNAMEAVSSLTDNCKTVQIGIFETAHNFAFEVSNSGYIPPDVLNKVFVEGFSTKPDKKDHGIGLASVRYLVKKNRGTVEVSSNLNEMVKFNVIFPK
ncbi:MAG: histidine kinase [Firmicutes bacterium HGW-Firmicutes-15]|nr:MAG: histidine kinase [Firmicutes bacterium HGW-Firmicutes-15]